MKIRIGKVTSWLGRVIVAAIAQEAVDRLTKTAAKDKVQDARVPAE